MTTEHVDSHIDEVLRASRELTEANEREHQRLLRLRDAATRQANEALVVLATATRAVNQRHDDTQATVAHNLDQTGRIRGDVPSTAPAADDDAPPAPADGFPPPAPAPQQDAPARPSLFDWIRSWTWIEWVCAILLAFVAIRWIAPATDQWVAGTVFNLDPDSETGDSSFWRSLVMTVWWILVVLAGFLIGGFIGSLIRSFVEGLREGRQQAQPDQPPAA